MIKDSGFIFSSNGGKLETAAGSQKSYDRVSHTHITFKRFINVQNCYVLQIIYKHYTTMNVKYLHTTPHIMCTVSHTA